MIYLDNNATTPPHAAVVEAMLPYLTTHYANPSSGSSAARTVVRGIERARESLATLLGCQPQELIFTSGGTEANHTAITSALALYPERKHIITAATEHDCVRQQLLWLEQHHGYSVTWLPVTTSGEISPTQVADALRPNDTALITMMFANNETGVLHPVAELAALAAEHDVFFHTDAVQAVGKCALNLAETKIHTLALSGHKFHGPKGIGALYVNRHAPFHPLLLGGGQENGRRAGTENVPGIIGLGMAAELAQSSHEWQRDAFEAALCAALPDTKINGSSAPRAPNTSNIYLPNTQAEGMMLLLEKAQISVSAGSACHTGALHPSYVLEAMGLDFTDARACLRVSFGRLNTAAEVAPTVAAIVAAAEKMRGLLTRD
jgi:cysteine desulfurase